MSFDKYGYVAVKDSYIIFEDTSEKLSQTLNSTVPDITYHHEQNDYPDFEVYIKIDSSVYNNHDTLKKISLIEKKPINKLNIL